MAVQLNQSIKPPCCHKARGFTLFEILVVIFIIGVITTFATLSIGNNADQQMEEEGKRLTALVRLASEEAIVANKELGLELAKTRYRFVDVNAGGEFAPIQDESSPLRPRQLPEGLELVANVNGEDVALADDVDFTIVKKDKDDEVDEDGEKTKTTSKTERTHDPVVIFILSSGEIVPFIIDVTREDGASYRVKGDYNGEINYLGRVKHEK